VITVDQTPSKYALSLRGARRFGHSDKIKERLILAVAVRQLVCPLTQAGVGPEHEIGFDERAGTHLHARLATEAKHELGRFITQS
jgi:hypothetical protein